MRRVVRQTGRSGKDRVFLKALMTYKGTTPAVVDGFISEEFKEHLNEIINNRNGKERVK